MKSDSARAKRPCRRAVSHAILVSNADDICVCGGSAMAETEKIDTLGFEMYEFAKTITYLERGRDNTEEVVHFLGKKFLPEIERDHSGDFFKRILKFIERAGGKEVEFNQLVF